MLPRDRDLAAEKAALRASARARRAKERPNGAAMAVAQAALAALPRLLQGPVAGYLALRDELDPGPLMAALAEQDIPLGLPCVIGPAAPLIFRRYRPGDPLRRAAHGTREPAPDREVLDPAVLLVPLLAFDRNGFRLGYGGGYYDRTLQVLRAQGAVLAVGLAYAFQEVHAVPHDDTDEVLDWVVTEMGAVRGAGRA